MLKSKYYQFQSLPKAYSGDAHFYRLVNGEPVVNCSAVILSDKLAVTAGHCVASDPIMAAYMAALNIQERLEIVQGEELIVVEAVAYPHVDVAIVRGDFVNLKKAKISPTLMFDRNTDYKVCGYPHDRKNSICVDLGRPAINNKEQMGFNAGIVSGMSGSGVYDNKGQVVGIAVSVGNYQVGGRSYAQPLSGLIGD